MKWNTYNINETYNNMERNIIKTQKPQGSQQVLQNSGLSFAQNWKWIYNEVPNFSQESNLWKWLKNYMI